VVQIHFKRPKLGGTDYPETPAHPMTFLFLGIYASYDLGKKSWLFTTDLYRSLSPLTGLHNR